MKALAGWALWFAGRGAEGTAWLDEARHADPDLPYGATLLAMLDFTQYVERQPAPFVTVSEAETRVSALAPETPEMRHAAARMAALLDEADRARVWGKGLAREFLSVLAALRAVREGKLADADRDLTEALDAASLRPLRGHLLLARSRVRLLDRRFEDALADLDVAVDLAPEVVSVRMSRAEVRAKLGDPKGGIEDLDVACRLDPDSPDPLYARAYVRIKAGDFAAALADARAALAKAPPDWAYRKQAEVIRETLERDLGK